MGNVISKIEDGSPLKHRIRVGDTLLAINGKEVIDVLDYKFFGYDPEVSVTVRTPEGLEHTVHVAKAEGQDLGLEFKTYLMDKPRSCANNCVFCFIDQLPKGMRRTMYFKDDDARLSFLLGNYITMTNLSDREIQRICDLHISPINVSVHATNPELRVKMLRNRFAGRCIDIMRRFAEAGIRMNCQIVCCPGLNDGDELERTMRELAEMHPAVHSVSIVPVGLTKFREGLYELKPFTPEHAGETIDLVTEFGDECLEKFGTRLFFCSDEMYICANRELPDDEFYEEHTQLENGVGMIRLLETEFKSALSLSDMPDGVPFSIACGVSVAPFFEKLVCAAREKYDNIDGRVYAIENDFFGHSINVTGLITGGDLINQLKDKYLGERLFISQNMLRREEMDFLDDVLLEDAVTALGVPIYPIGQDGFDLWDAISGDDLPEVKLPDRDGQMSRFDKEQFYKYNQNGG
ncbi:MAG TPA: radical SAM protein [Clostridiales bacterium]|nr:radical SAM protein [Clostridiales bacterium]